MLPDYDAVIFDEAHTLEAVASDHLGIGVTSGQVDYLLNKLYNDRTNKGLLVQPNLAEEQRVVLDCRHLADQFFDDVYAFAQQPGNNDRPRPQAGAGAERPVASPGASSRDDLQVRRRAISRTIRKQAGLHSPPPTALFGLAQEIEKWRRQELDQAPCTGSRSRSSRHGRPRSTLAAAPIDVGPALRSRAVREDPAA